MERVDSKWPLFIIRGCYIILENEGTGIIAGPFTLGYQEIDCFLVLHISDLVLSEIRRIIRNSKRHPFRSGITILEFNLRLLRNQEHNSVMRPWY